MKHTPAPLLGLALVTASALAACASAPRQPETALQAASVSAAHCYEFDGLVPLERYNIGETFDGRNAVIHFQPYLLNGAQYFSGFGYTNHTGIVNGTPPEYKPYAVATEFTPDTPAQRVTFKFGEILQGIHSNFAVNGSAVEEGGSLTDFDGRTIGGVQVSVTLNPVVGKNTGTVELTAVTQDITSFTFGGRTLYIDDFCHE